MQGTAGIYSGMRCLFWLVVVLSLHAGWAVAQRPALKIDAAQPLRGHLQVMYEQPLGLYLTGAVGLGPTWKDGLFHTFYSREHLWGEEYTRSTWGTCIDWEWGLGTTLQLQTRPLNDRLRWQQPHETWGVVGGIQLQSRYYRWTQEYDYVSVVATEPRIAQNRLDVRSGSHRFVDLTMYYGLRCVVGRHLFLEWTMGGGVRRRWVDWPKVESARTGLQSRQRVQTLPSFHLGLKLGFLLPVSRRRLENP